jgi:hypothetical protein
VLWADEKKSSMGQKTPIKSVKIANDHDKKHFILFSGKTTI